MYRNRHYNSGANHADDLASTDSSTTGTPAAFASADASTTGTPAAFAASSYAAPAPAPIRRTYCSVVWTAYFSG